MHVRVCCPVMSSAVAPVDPRSTIIGAALAPGHSTIAQLPAPMLRKWIRSSSGSRGTSAGDTVVNALLTNPSGRL